MGSEPRSEGNLCAGARPSTQGSWRAMTWAALGAVELKLLPGRLSPDHLGLW